MRGLKYYVLAVALDPPEVAPHVGAWIEILLLSMAPELSGSHPTWVRGLKLTHTWNLSPLDYVAPHVGAWIEILKAVAVASGLYVAPHVGAWIEISKSQRGGCRNSSHPTWVRGLKF